MWGLSDQGWSGIIGDALSGAIMLLVLVVTLTVQSKQNKKLMTHQSEQVTHQLNHQQEQFQKQLEANEDLLREQMRLERLASSNREIILLSAKVRRNLLKIESIATNGKNYDQFEDARYELLSLNKQIESHITPGIRPEYKKLTHIYDRTCILLRGLINLRGGSLAGTPLNLGSALGALLGLHQEWVDAYIDGDSSERHRLHDLIEANLRSFEDLRREEGTP